MRTKWNDGAGRRSELFAPYWLRAYQNGWRDGHGPRFHRQRQGCM